MLALYYFAYPPFGASLAMHNQPGVFIVNAQLIEAAVLLVFVFLRESGYGLQRLLPGFHGTAGAADAPAAADGRREKLVGKWLIHEADAAETE